jgi:trans-2,3-dihydro-3-hydroxyanthranilate isomerase
MTDFDYEIWDVFTDTPFEGNPLAVVWKADALSLAQMQTVTKEFNLSESVFILSPDDPAHDARLKIFTPAYEMPFAGHPTVGASIAIATAQGASDRLQLELNTGLFDVALQKASGKLTATFANPVAPAEAGPAPDLNMIARAIGLDVQDIETGAHKPRLVGAGVNFVYVKAPIDVVRRAKFDSAGFEALDLHETIGILLYADGGDKPDVAFHVRMFAPGAGVPEDPATGSAACALPGQIAASGDLEVGDYDWLIEQGVEMGRPSYIRVRFEVENGEARRVRVGGGAVKIASGVIHV